MTIWRMRISRWIRKITDLQPEYVTLFHCNNGCTNAPHCYVVRTLPGLNSGQNLRKIINVTYIYISARVSCFHSNYAYIIPHEEQKVVHRPMQKQVFAFRMF
jgi:hypothetical protein